MMRTWHVDTATLPPDRAKRVEDLAKKARRGKGQAGNDAFSYEITIDGETFSSGDAEELVNAIDAE